MKQKYYFMLSTLSYSQVQFRTSTHKMVVGISTPLCSSTVVATLPRLQTTGLNKNSEIYLRFAILRS